MCHVLFRSINQSINQSISRYRLTYPCSARSPKNSPFWRQRISCSSPVLEWRLVTLTCTNREWVTPQNQNQLPIYRAEGYWNTWLLSDMYSKVNLEADGDKEEQIKRAKALRLQTSCFVNTSLSPLVRSVWGPALSVGTFKTNSPNVLYGYSTNHQKTQIMNLSCTCEHTNNSERLILTLLSNGRLN